VLLQGFRAQGGCSTVYTKFHEYLGASSVKLGVTEMRIKRGNKEVKVAYRQGASPTLTTTCRRLVVSGLQTLSNMETFLTDMDATERAVFSQVGFVEP
jgi:hypothetical protein